MLRYLGVKIETAPMAMASFDVNERTVVTVEEYDGDAPDEINNKSLFHFFSASLNTMCLIPARPPTSPPSSLSPNPVHTLPLSRRNQCIFYLPF